MAATLTETELYTLPEGPVGGRTGREWLEILERFYCDGDSGTPCRGPVGIAGAGLMGISIAAAFLQGGYSILLYDVLEGARETAASRLRKELVLQGVRDAEAIDELFSARFRVTGELAELGACPIVVETIIEKLKLKRKLYQQLDQVVLPGTMLFSNTSTIEIGLLAEGLAGCGKLVPERMCGFHFFHPVRKRALLEVIRGPETTESTVDAACGVARAIGKCPITVNDGPGFLVNSLLNPYLNESLVLLEEGYPMSAIERVCSRLGMEMGPFRIMDEIGLDVALHSGWSIACRHAERVTARQVLPTMVRGERFGRKRGRGFYRYEGTSTLWEDEGVPDETLGSYLAENGVQLPCRKEVTEEEEGEMASRILLGILLEAGRLVEDGVIGRIGIADLALVRGLGFSAERGGICHWADAVGLGRILAVADRYRPLGERFLVPEILRSYAEEERPLTSCSDGDDFSGTKERA